MEADRRALGLHDIRFRYFCCPRCGYDDIFVDVVPMPNETSEEFAARKRRLELSVRTLHGEQTELVVDERG
jgi:hypothetical protein